jgi:hypothetical protein
MEAIRTVWIRFPQRRSLLPCECEHCRSSLYLHRLLESEGGGIRAHSPCAKALCIRQIQIAGRPVNGYRVKCPAITDCASVFDAV